MVFAIHISEHILRQKLYKKTISRKKVNFQKGLVEKLSNVRDAKEFWTTVKLFKCHTPVNYLDITAWETFYDTVYTRSRAPLLSFLDPRHPLLDTPITESELTACLSKCKNGRTPGMDAISYEFIKAVPQNWFLYICTMFNRILDTETVPTAWGEISLSMIHKKGSPYDPLNYRGIALVNCLAKIFTHILLDRLSLWSESEAILPECQSGFRPNRGCIDNIFVLTSIIQINLRLKKRKVFAAFIDFRRAFDSVDHSILWRKLYGVGVSSKIIRIIRDLYCKATVQVKLQGEYSNKFEVTEGVLQGECLSPLLFALFLSDVEKCFRDRKFRGLSIDGYNDVIMLLYADDLVLLSDSQGDLNKKLAYLSQYCRENNLTVNAEKTKVVCFGRGGYRHFSDFQFSFENNKIDVVNKFSYLGVSFSSSGLFLDMINSKVDAAKMTAGSLINLMYRMGMQSWASKVTLYNNALISTLTDCIAVWGLNYREILETIQVRFLKRLLSLPRCTPGFILRLETGLSNLSQLVFKLALNWLQKLLTMRGNRYPRLCYLRLLELDSKKISCYNYNWVSQIKRFFIEIHREQVWPSLDATNLKMNKTVFLNQYKCFLRRNDLSQLESSRYSVFFGHYSYYSGLPKSYLTFRCSTPIVKILAQLRMANTVFVSFFVNGCYYKINTTEICTMCNLGEFETISHIFFKCPLYRGVRGDSIKEMCDIDGLIQALENVDLLKAKAIFYFVTNALKLRSFILNE